MPGGAHLELPRAAPTPADLCLLACLVGLLVGLPLHRHPPAKRVTLEVTSAAGTCTLDLRVDRDLTLAGPAGETLLRLRGGRAWIAEAPCRFHLCQRMGPIHDGEGSLICVPNEIVVRFAAVRKDVDGVTR